MSSPRSVIIALAALLGAAAPAAAQTAPPIQLPADVTAEAMTAAGGAIYTGNFYDGSVWRVDPATGQATTLVAAKEGRNSMGIAFKGRRMLVAGGTSGNVFVYDRTSGADLGTYELGGALVNDITVLGNTAYVTETFKDVLYAIPLRAGAQPRTIELDGVPFDAGTAEQPGVNADGIVTAGNRLILNHYDSGRLFLINPRTGKARKIAIGRRLRTADGMLLRGRTLWVTQNSGAFSRIRLSRNLRSGRIVASDEAADYKNPVDVAIAGGRPWVLNSPDLLDPSPDVSAFLLPR